MFKNNLLIFFGFFLVLLLLWNRLIRTRLPTELNSNLNKLTIFIYTFLLVCILIAFFYNILLLLKSSAHKKNAFSILWGKLYLLPYNPLHIINNSLTALDAFIKNNMPIYNAHQSYGDFFIETLGLKCSKYTKTSLLILYLFKLVPQLFVCFLFFLDVTYFHRFDYFYKSLWLLILPIMMSYIIYSLRTLIVTNLDSLDSIMIFKVKLNDFTTEYINLTPEIIDRDFNHITVYQWYNVVKNTKPGEYLCYNSFTENYRKNFSTAEEEQLTINYCLEFLQKAFNIYQFLETYDNYKTKIEIPSNIFRYFIYLLGWVYILLYGCGYL